MNNSKQISQWTPHKQEESECKREGGQKRLQKRNPFPFVLFRVAGNTDNVEFQWQNYSPENISRDKNTLQLQSSYTNTVWTFFLNISLNFSKISGFDTLESTVEQKEWMSFWHLDQEPPPRWKEIKFTKVGEHNKPQAGGARVTTDLKACRAPGGGVARGGE